MCIRDRFWGALFAPTDPTGSTVYALDHSRGIDVLALDRTALRPVRRQGSPPSGALRSGFSMFVWDGYEVVRPGQPLRIGLGVDGQGGPVDVRATLPRALVDVQPSTGGSFDPATRTVRFRLQRAGRVRFVRARVARSARRGALLETIGYVSGPDDPFLLDDRGVDHSVVVRRGRRAAPSSVAARPAAARSWAAATPVAAPSWAATAPAGFCRLP